MTLNAGENELFSAVIDTANGFAYFGAVTYPQGRVVKVRLSDFTRVGALTLNDGERGFCAVIDTANGFAYFGAPTIPGTVVKVRLLDLTRVGALTLNSGEDGELVSAVIDTANGFAYFGTDGSTVVKVRLSDFTRVGALTLNGGESDLISAVIDTTNGFAYFGTGASPGKVVKMRLSDFTRVDALTLNSGENFLSSAVIDTANSFAYFGTGTQPGIVIRVDLSGAAPTPTPSPTPTPTPTPTPMPTPIQLLLEEAGPVLNQAAALDSVLFLRDPFPVVNGADLLNLGVDRNTRVLVFVANLQLLPDETSSSVIVNLVDSNNQSYDVPAEDVRPVSNLAFVQVTFRLPDNLAVGTCTVTIKAHGQVSNAGTMRII